MIDAKTQELVARLLRTPSGLLTHLDKQLAFLAREYSREVPCPECGRKLAYLEAVDPSFNFDDAAHPACACPECRSALELVLPLMGGWYWMKKAAFDRARSGK